MAWVFTTAILVELQLSDGYVDLLGTPLFMRARNNVQFTAQGERLVRHAETMTEVEMKEKKARVEDALQNAASIAGLMITTEAMVAEEPKKEAHGHGAGMGGMGY